MKEAEIRPLDLFSRYLALAREDAENFFDLSCFVEVPCPGCGGGNAQPAFEKYGFRYVVCETCNSLFSSPRPSRQVLADYYREGKAVQFWGSEFYRVTAESRREKIFRPRAELVAQLAAVHRDVVEHPFLDVGAGYGIFLEEVQRLGLFERIVGIEPSPALAGICRQKGFEIVQKYAEDLEGREVQGGVTSAFEVLEHVFDPSAFLQGVHRALRARGLIVFTTLSVSGLDLQVLWEHSNSIYPPHHLNLLSVEGMETLVERSGFELVELTTPGKLDLDIIVNTLKENSGLQLPRFVSYMLKCRGEQTRAELQQFLQNHRLSSHIRVIARKRP